jgi:hypothetical protein
LNPLRLLTTVLSSATSSLGLRCPGTGQRDLVSSSHCMIFGLEGLSIEISIIEETTDWIQIEAYQQADVVVILTQLS